MTTHDAPRSTDRLAAAAGITLVAATVATLVATPPPPQLDEAARVWTAYLTDNRAGLMVASIATCVAALSLVVLAARVAAARLRPGSVGLLLGTAGVAASGLVLGGVVQADLADQAGRLGGGAVLALVGVVRGLLYVVPAYGFAALAAAVVGTAQREAAWWRGFSWVIVVVTAAAAVMTTASTSSAAAGIGFLARLLFTVWAATTAWRTASAARAAAPAIAAEPLVA